MARIGHPGRWVLAATAILVALVVVAGVSVYARADRPIPLTAVCTGEGTQTARCTWIPVED